MALPIITADQRLREKKGVKLVLLGKSGIGKTTQLKTLPEDKTLFVDLEAGDLAVKDWRGDCVRPTTWPEFRDLVVFLAGPNPALPPEAPYSQAHYAHVCEQYGDPSQLTKYDCYFVDSITVLARLALIWAKTQPQAMSDRTGKPDTRGAYGLLGSEMLGALMHLQHARAEIKAEDGAPYRAFVTHTLNPYGFPAKDRSGQLEMLEPPNLLALIEKCAAATQPQNYKE